jgi:hypothetical protein
MSSERSSNAFIADWADSIEACNGGQTLTTADYVPEHDISLAVGSVIPINTNGFKIVCRYSVDLVTGRVFDEPGTAEPKVNEKPPWPQRPLAVKFSALLAGSPMTQEAKARTCKNIKGKTVDSLVWQPPQDGDDGYWVLNFTDDSEICFNRLMAECV